MKRHPLSPLKATLLAVWLVLISTAIYFMFKSGTPLEDYPDMLQDYFESADSWGVLLYITAYTLRPLILLPPFVLCAAGGLVFGPVRGILYTVIGENLSAALAFYLARYFGREWFSKTELKLVRQIDRHIRENGFTTVLMLRLAHVPFDAVSFGCGLTNIPYGEYALATALGALPSIMSFVYFGSSWYQPRNLAVSAVMLALSLALARVVRKAEKKNKSL